MRGWRAQAHASSSLAFGTILILVTAFFLSSPSLATTVVIYASRSILVVGVDGQTQIYSTSDDQPAGLATGRKFATVGSQAGVATYQLYAFTSGQDSAGSAKPDDSRKAVSPSDYRWDRWIEEFAQSDAAAGSVPEIASALAEHAEAQFVNWENVLGSPGWRSRPSPAAELVGYFLAGFDERRPYLFHLRLPIDRDRGELRPIEVTREYDGGPRFYINVAGSRDLALAALRRPDSTGGRQLARDFPAIAKRVHARRPHPLSLEDARSLVLWLLRLEAAGGDETGGPLTVATATRDQPDWKIETEGPSYQVE